MELQELVVRVAIGQMRFRLAPRFADVRGTLIEEIVGQFDLTDYGWAEAQLHVQNEDRTRIAVVGSREARFVSEHLERIDDYVEGGRNFFSYVIDVLGVTEVEYLGVRTFWMAAVDSYDDLVGWTRERFSPSEPFSAVASSRLTDVGWMLEYHEKDPKLSVRLGPMKLDQAIEQFLATDKRDLFPEQFLWVDIDRMYNEERIPVERAVERWEDSLRKSLELGRKIAAGLGDNQ